jgi:hypothetical protein
MPAIMALDDEEMYLAALLDDPSGIDLAEMIWTDDTPGRAHRRYRLWDFQYSLYWNENTYQADKMARALGKSVGIIMRACAFPFNFPGQEMLITAPELNHLSPIVDKVEERFNEYRLLREMLPPQKGGGIKHQPQFQATFMNSSRIMGRLPNHDGRGVKGSIGAGALILTRRGQVKVEDIHVGDEVFTHMGRWRPVEHVVSYFNPEVVTVNGGGHRGLVMSANHRMLARRALNGPKQKRDLAQSQFLIPAEEPDTRFYFGSPTQFEPEITPVWATPELLWLAGRYVADGHLMFQMMKSGAERRVPRRVMIVAEAHEVVDLTTRVANAGLHPAAVVVRDNGSIQTGFCSTDLARIWRDEFGQHSDGKCIPTWLLGASEEHRRAFLEGYLSGDGWWDEQKQRWTFSSASKELAIGLRLLGQSLGWAGSYSWVDPDVTHICGRALKVKPMRAHRVTLSGSKNQAVMEKHQQWMRVRSIMPAEPQMVYDLHVKDDHSYLADGLISHNQHPLILELDEGQDYVQAGWVELIETMKHGIPGAQWRAHGVSNGVRDMYHRVTSGDADLPFFVHHYPAMYRPTWSPEERRQKIAIYGGSRDNPDYKRNIYGEAGDVSNRVFVLARLMACRTPGTSIYQEVDGQVRATSVENIRVGDSVLNAIGTGTVTDVIPSRRDHILVIGLDGHDEYCTPEHPFFTDHGWRHADRLQPGDRIFTLEGLRGLWQDADLTKSAQILFTKMRGDGEASGASLAGVSDLRDSVSVSLGGEVLQYGMPNGWSQDLWGVPHVQQGDPSSATDDMLAGMCGSTEAGSQPTSRDGMPLLREAFGGEEQLSLLQSRVLERQPSTCDWAEGVPPVRNDLYGEVGPEVLLANLLLEVGGSDLQAIADQGVEVLCALRDRVLSCGQEGEVLLQGVRERTSDGRAIADGVVRSLLGDVSTIASDASLLLEGVLVCEQGKAQTSQAVSPYAQERAGRVAHGSVRALAGVGRRVATRVVDQPLGGSWGGSDSVSAGSGPSVDEDCRRGGRAGTLHGEGHGAGSYSRRMAMFARVDCVEVHERGSEVFDRLSGGEDQVTVYDLTVSGHPSYFAGDAPLLNHNCVRINESTWATDYNENVYTLIKVEGESLERRPIESFINLPLSHLNKSYSSYWAGMDIGFTRDPSELLIFGVTKAKRNGEDVDLLRLLARIHLMRVSAVDQEKVIAKVFGFYGDRLRALSMDKSGAGLPVWQHMDKDPAHKGIRDRVKGYGFSEKRAVEYDDRPLVGREVPEDAMIEKNIIMFATDKLREYVDAQMLELPYDKELLTEFQGQVVVYSRNDGDSKTGSQIKFGAGSYHTLDSAKVMILGKELESIEAALAPKRRRGPVLEQFVS